VANVNATAIAAISAGAAVFGALVGGGAQLLVVRVQHRHDQAERRRAQKREIYRDYLHLVSGMPDLQVRTTGHPESTAMLRTEFTEPYDRLRGDLALFGTPEIRQGVEAVWIACEKAFDDYDRLRQEDMSGLVEQSEAIRRAFDRNVAQPFSDMAKAMAKDSDSA
jgi:hypothetical protein